MPLLINIHLHHMLNKSLLVEEIFQAQSLQETQKDFSNFYHWYTLPNENLVQDMNNTTHVLNTPKQTQ